MKTTVTKTSSVYLTDRLLNGFILKNINTDYAGLASNETGMGVYSDGTVTIRVYNGTLGVRGTPWTAMTPTKTYVIGEYTVNEYVGNFVNRWYWPSANCERAEVTTNGTYIWPLIRNNVQAYEAGAKISIGSWMSLPQSRMDVTRLELFEDVTIKQWTDMLDIKEAVGPIFGNQVRIPRNIVGNPKDFASFLEKYYVLNNYAYIYGFGTRISGATLTEATQEIAKIAPAGSRLHWYLTQSPAKDNLHNKDVTFDGQGGYSVQ